MTSPYDRIHLDRNFHVIKSGGQVLNRRNLGGYRQAINIFHLIGGTGNIELIKGSYISDDGTSAGTHQGGGAGDTQPTIPTAKNWRLWEKAQRMCMFASWDRPELWRDGKLYWDHHNHAGYLGDKQASGALRSQYSDFYVGRNGLAGHALDPSSKYRPPVIFTPIYPLHHVNLHNVVEQAKATKKTKITGVERVQRSLNKKLGTELKVDGIFGADTKKKYARWERSIGGDGDGIPAIYSLSLLGAGRFNVVKD